MSAGPSFTLVATMRNEGPYILEWLAYHHAIGFTDFLICSNDCVDGSDDLLDLLDELGLATHIRCHPADGEKPQLVAYDAAARRLSPASEDWLMVLDADEFLNIHAGKGRVADLVAQVPEATAFHINWRIFGSSGLRHWSRELVTERFTRAAGIESGVNWSFKTLFQQAEAYDCMLLPHGPGFARPECISKLRHVDSSGKALGERYVRAEQFLQLRPTVWDLAQVNHYNTRSWEDYLVKNRRYEGKFAWDRDSNWAIFNRNEERDLSVYRHLPTLRRELDELMRIPAIADAHRSCCELYGRHVNALVEDSLVPTAA